MSTETLTHAETTTAETSTIPTTVGGEHTISFPERFGVQAVDAFSFGKKTEEAPLGIDRLEEPLPEMVDDPETAESARHLIEDLYPDPETPEQNREKEDEHSEYLQLLESLSQEQEEAGRIVEEEIATGHYDHSETNPEPVKPEAALQPTPETIETTLDTLEERLDLPEEMKVEMRAAAAEYGSITNFINHEKQISEQEQLEGEENITPESNLEFTTLHPSLDTTTSLPPSDWYKSQKRELGRLVMLYIAKQPLSKEDHAFEQEHIGPLYQQSTFRYMGNTEHPDALIQAITAQSRLVLVSRLLSVSHNNFEHFTQMMSREVPEAVIRTNQLNEWEEGMELHLEYEEDHLHLNFSHNPKADPQYRDHHNNLHFHETR